MRKIGRYTAAIMLLTVGMAMILDKATGSMYTNRLVQWWPALLILFGAEYVLLHLGNMRNGKRLRLDVGSLLFAGVLSFIAVGMTNNAMPHDNRLSLGGIFSFAGEAGYRFNKDPLHVPLSPDITDVIVDNPSGNVTVKAAHVEDIAVEAVVWVDQVDKEEAAQIAEQSGIEFHSENDSNLTISAQGKEYGHKLFGKRKPRINLVVTIPVKQKMNMELQLINGKAEAAGLPIRERFAATTTNGEISVSGLAGDVRLKSTNGKIFASHMEGQTTLKTTNGTVSLQNSQGNADLSSTNGEVLAENIKGTLRIKTTNGSITVSGVEQSLNARSTNGAIRAASSKIDGDWELETTRGSIEVGLPSNADMEVKGEGVPGRIASDFPLQTDNRSIRGTIGNGKHRLIIETNGAIAIHKED